MESRHIQKIIHENKLLKQKNRTLHKEIDAIKTSKAFKSIRLAGKIRDEVKKSPTKFAKKAAKKIWSRSVKKTSHGYADTFSYGSLVQREYERWIDLNEPTEFDLEEQRRAAENFKKKPLISIITPVFNPPVKVFEELIESVIGQTYFNFELCLGNFGDDVAIAELIEAYAKKDARIKYWHFKENAGIAENSNKILEKVGGDYVALLDHDDTLSRDALYENVKLLNQDNYDFIYSDKDKIDELGHRFDPFFKPDWSPEMMLNVNYLTHLNLMRTDVMRKIQGWRKETDGAQDWDIFLRFIDASNHKVGHIPKILYHWRVIASSTAMSIDTKPYALKGQRVAVNDYLKQHRISADTYHHGAEILIKWPIAEKAMKRVIIASSSARIHEILTADEDSIVLVEFEDTERLKKAFPRVNFISYEPKSLIAALSKAASLLDDDNVMVSYDNLMGLDTKAKDALAGWLSVEGVFGVAPMIMHGDNILDTGGIYQEGQLCQLFKAPLPYLQTPIGNIEWVRNLQVVSSHMIVTSAGNLKKVIEKSVNVDDEENWIVYLQQQLSEEGRLVFDPKHKAQSLIDNDPYPLSEFDGRYTDCYSNVNIECSDVVHIRPFPYGHKEEDADAQPSLRQSADYTYDAIALANNIRIEQEDLDLNRETITHSHNQRIENLESITFILPGFSAIYAGLNNILNYAESLSGKFGLEVTFAFLDEPNKLGEYQKVISEKYPHLGSARYIVTDFSANQLPYSDIAVCTQWATAYVLLKHNKTKRKCYFIQDKEASFYPMGTISSLAQLTYQFGFFALANTPGLLEWYKTTHGGSGTVVKSIVDLSRYSPAESWRADAEKPYKVFFYGRPSEPRNAFELGLAALTQLKRKYGKDVEIYSAGADWLEDDYDVAGIIKNLGKIPFDKLPHFYRSMDVGMMFMFSGHPGVVASELMASGCPVVVNEYDDVTWRDLYRNGETCIVALPNAQSVYEAIEKGLTDKVLRQTVRSGGLKKVSEYYSDYNTSLEQSVGLLRESLH